MMTESYMSGMVKDWAGSALAHESLLGSMLLGDLPEVTASLVQLRMQQSGGSMIDTVRNMLNKIQQALTEFEREWTEINGE